MNDVWEFKKSNLRKWRWRRIAPNGDVVGSSPMGYWRRTDCEGNAQLNGWSSESMSEQNAIAEENINQENHQLVENGNSLEKDNSALETHPDQGTENLDSVERDSRQRRLLILIASILGLILIATLLILFKTDGDVESSDISLITTAVISK